MSPSPLPTPSNQTATPKTLPYSNYVATTKHRVDPNKLETIHKNKNTTGNSITEEQNKRIEYFVGLFVIAMKKIRGVCVYLSGSE